jgi:ABC-type nitrate/sulfonate/bicarbonate transport system permease component
MAVAYRTLETPTMYVAILAISLIGYALDRTLLLARRRMLAEHWPRGPGSVAGIRPEGETRGG